jgi:hypothetical protein
MIPIKDTTGLFRDEETNAVLNCNEHEYNEYLKIKNAKLQEKQELDKIKTDIQEIKDCLKIIIERINN